MRSSISEHEKLGLGLGLSKSLISSTVIIL